MAGKPPTAKGDLQHEDYDAYQQAHGITAIGRQVKSERKINEGTDNGLRDVVRQAHASVEAEVGDGLAKARRLVKPEEGSDEHGGEGQFLPHVESGPGGLLDERFALHQFFVPSIKGRKEHGAQDEYPHPEYPVGFGCGKMSGPS